MALHTTKAIVLRATPFQESQTIVTLFSQNLGLVPMILRKASAKRTFFSFAEPFCEAEFLLYEGTSEIVKFRDGSVITQNLSLREDLSRLQTASSMVRALLRSQLPREASPDLYTLFSAFLRQIPLSSSLTTLHTFFYLKLLKHEGVYHPHYEEEHTGLFLPEEQKLLYTLMFCQNFKELHDKECSSSLLQRVAELFYSKTGN